MGEPIKWERIEDQVKRLGRVGAWAPGSYLCKCLSCETTFEGDKRAMSCLPCAVARLDAIASKATDEEALARVLCTADGYDPDEHVRGGQAQGFEDYGPRWKADFGSTNYLALARAIISHITEAPHG